MKKNNILKIFAAVMILLVAVPAVLAGSINPSIAYTDDSLSAVESQPSQYTFKWYKNGGYITDGQTLSSSNTAKGEVWKVEWWLNALGMLVDFAQVTILNTIPTDPVVSFLGDPYYANSTVSVNGTSTDLDGDTLVYTYVFRNNTALLQNSTTSTYVCAGSCPKGENISVEVWTYDGEAYANNSAMNSTIIQNTNPENLTVNTTPASVYVGTEINASGIANDLDGDALTYTFQFYNLNTSTVLQAYSSDNTYEVTSASAHNTINVFVNVSDGTGSITNFTNITVLNTAPTMNLTNFSLYQDLNATVNLSGYSNDNDTDALTYTTLNSTNITALMNGDSITFVPDTGYFGSQFVNVTINDGIVGTVQPINVTVIPNTSPTISALNITNPACTSDNLTGNFTLTDADQTSLTAYVNWYKNSVLNQSSTESVTNGTVNLINLSSTLTLKGENWTLQVIPNDGIVNGTSQNISVVISNTAPTTTTIPIQGWAQNVNQTINLSLYFSDADSDDLNFTAVTGNNITAYVDNSTNLVILEPDTGFAGSSTVNFTAFDNENANVTSNVVTLNVGFSVVTDSTINGTLYSGTNNYTNISGVFLSTINSSTITGPTINVDNSNVTNSTIINSNLINCTVIDTTLTGAYCLNAYIDPSDIGNSNTTGSTIYDSTIWDSNFTNSLANNSIVYNSSIDSSNVTYSNFTNVTMDNSIVVNSQLNNTVISSANITSNVLYSGTMLMTNGTVYNATSGGQQNITGLVNFAPIATIANPANASSHNNGATVYFNSSSTDVNVGDFLNDTLTYFWDFGDGTNATTENASHSYSTDNTYNVVLTVTDSYNETDNSTITLTVSTPSSGGGGGGGGGGSSSTPSGGTLIVLANGETRVLSKNHFVTFDFGGEEHKVTLEDILSDFVKIVVESDPQTGLLEKNKSLKFNLDGDAYLDLEVLLKDKTSFTATLQFNLLFEDDPAWKPVEVVEDVEDDEVIEEKNETEERKLSWKTITGRALDEWNESTAKVKAISIKVWNSIKNNLLRSISVMVLAILYLGSLIYWIRTLGTRKKKKKVSKVRPLKSKKTKTIQEAAAARQKKANFRIKLKGFLIKIIETAL